MQALHSSKGQERKLNYTKRKTRINPENNKSSTTTEELTKGDSNFVSFCYTWSLIDHSFSISAINSAFDTPLPQLRRAFKAHPQVIASQRPLLFSQQTIRTRKEFWLQLIKTDLPSAFPGVVFWNFLAHELKAELPAVTFYLSTSNRSATCACRGEIALLQERGYISAVLRWEVL